MSYGNVYVARVAMGASDTQTVHAFVGAARYHGPSLILAYSHCIAHGINMRTATDNQKAAVDCGHWPLCRYDPERARRGESPLRLDSRPPRRRFSDYARLEARYTMLARSHPEQARQLLELAQEDVNSRWRLYEEIARAPGDGKKRPERAEGAERAKGAEQAKGAEESL
jgi:pyruvate-ferredoxin/flavodoxin oxidoreductase